MKAYWILASVLVLSTARTSLGDLVLLPENEAVVGGIDETVTLRCAANNAPPFTRIIWTEFSTNSLGTIVSDNRNIVLSHPNAARYSIVGDAASHEFFLQIRGVVLADGGRYLCQDVNAPPPNVLRGSADLVVLDTEPRCTDYTTGGGVVIDGQMYSAECEIRYQGRVGPRVEWIGPPGYYFRNSTNPPNSVWSWMAFTALREMDGVVFYHHTNFTEFPPLPDYATNAPSYTHTYPGPPLDVNWLPTAIDVTPIKEFYELGDVLTCFADSKPPSQYQWQNMRTLQFAPPGSTFTITADLLGLDQVMRCNVNVLIDGSMHSGDRFVNVSVPAPTTTPPTTAPPTTTPPPADGPCQDLSGRWQSTNPSATICLDVDRRGNIFIIIRNSTDMFFVAGRGKTVYDDYRHVGFTAHWPNTGVGGFSGECHSCYGTEVLLMSGLYRNKHAHEECGASAGTGLTQLFVFTRAGSICVGQEVDEVRTDDPAIVERLGVKAKKISPLSSQTFRQ